ncbi:hypothetical protein N836_00120 [Leptolyngbya sp. Heron Island J]|uniref:hypothetical protein n=1 Tax=Leptolyngbya sp. Heron Island J TaxID=1385935 RepID=UPI0003B93BAC|nr:hypothetical protein [Leptolyngbya sp. Heron Island J]ESA37119.1 hypothetical protein N836_00120 [Leptolyngbya sp. Heron Island J]
MAQHTPNQEQENNEDHKDWSVEGTSISLDEISHLIRNFNGLIEQFRGLSRTIFGSQPRETQQESKAVNLLRYEDLIQYFVEAKPDDLKISQGALIKEYKGSKYLILQIFLDKNYEIVSSSSGKPYGRRILAKKLDQELVDAFNGKEMIIVK